MTGKVFARSVNRIPKIAWVVLALIFMVRMSSALIILNSPEKSIWPDTNGYLVLARNLVAGEGYQSGQEDSLDLRRTPGYPALLALLFSIFGESYPAVVFVQLLMGAAIGWALYSIGSGHFSPFVGYLSAFLFALTPNSIFWSLSILSDTLFTLTLVVAFFSASHFFLRGTYRDLVLSGLLIGFATLVRPIGVLIIPLWALILAGYKIARKAKWLEVTRVGLFFVVASAIIVGPWVIRNAIVWDRPTVSSIGIAYLGRYQAPAALARAKGITLEEARKEIPANWLPGPGDSKRFIGIIMRYPIDYFAAHIQGTWILLTEATQPNLAQLLGVHYSGSGLLSAILDGDWDRARERLQEVITDSVDRTIFIGTWFSRAFQLIVYITSMVGAYSIFQLNSSNRWLGILVVCTVGVLVLLPGPVGTGRFRVPAEPFLALLAGVGLSRIVQMRSKRKY